MTAQNQYKNYTDDEIVGEAATVQMKQGSLLAEMMRRLKDSVSEGNTSASKLSKRIERLTFWLLVFTIAIFALTGVLVWLAVREILK